MANATQYALMHQYAGASLLAAFNDNESLADILQIVTPGGTVIVAVSYTGVVQFNASGLTASEGAGGTGLYTLNRQLDRQYSTIPGATITTVAQAFASAFSLNPQNLDIIQVYNPGGNISYWLDYLGIAHGA
jgi:hypothetical protein